MKIIRNITGSFIALILLILFKNKAIKKINNMNVLSLYFHKPTPDIFEKSIKWLKDNGFSFIDVKKLESILSGIEKIDEKLVFISFDDGWRVNLSLIPIIEKYNVPILIFISTEPILSGNFWWEYIANSNNILINKRKQSKRIKMLSNEKRIKFINNLKDQISLKRSALELGELIELSNHKLVTIGSHTVNHPITTNCDDDELDMEYRVSKENLTKWINKDIKYFAYPNGHYNKRDLLILKKYGYKLAFTTKPCNIKPSSNKYELPRFNVNNEGSMIINKAKMLGLWQNYIPKFFLQNN